MTPKENAKQVAAFLGGMAMVEFLSGHIIEAHRLLSEAVSVGGTEVLSKERGASLGKAAQATLPAAWIQFTLDFESGLAPVMPR